MPKPTKTRTIYRATWHNLPGLCDSFTLISDLHGVFDVVIKMGRKPDEVVSKEIESDSPAFSLTTNDAIH